MVFPPSGKARPTEGKHQYQLYAFPTPNAFKLTILLEELSEAYDVHIVDIIKNDQFNPWFLELSPNNKMPALVDTKGPSGQRVTMFESGAILIYLAEKHNRFIPADPVKRSECIQWIMWQMAGLGPMSGQFGHFWKYAKVQCPYAKQRYFNEVERLLRVLDNRLRDHTYVVGDEYTIADMAIHPWVRGIDQFYGLLHVFDPLPNVRRWLAAISARAAVVRGYAGVRAAS